ncbi:MAG: hypothetical protein CMB32_03220 [Euryarchaeota archaeon]|nr:hypothetical protein [Euryarchaeota archaeon]
MSHKEGNFVILRASAGSGKTYRLVLMYLECALRYDDPKSFRRILALTFTNKAAAEMKSRILEDLEKLIAGKSDKEQKLCKELGLNSKDLKSRASLLHKEMLHRYSDISVMTIDKFVNKLVKSFARDLALEQDYRIEVDSNKVLEEAVSQLLEKLGEPGNKDLTNLLQSFALSKVDDDQDSGVRNPLTKLGRTLLQEKMKGVIEVLSKISPVEFKKISEELRSETKKTEDHFYSLVDEAIDKINNSGIPDDCFPSRGSIKKILNDLRYVKIADPTTTFCKIVEDPRSMLKKGVDEIYKKNAENLHQDILSVYENLQLLRPSTPEGKRYLVAKKLNKRIALMGTLAALHQEIEKVQADNNIRTFHAMHERISDIVTNNQAPFIYERLGARYNHIFMDEFQDTSVTQWHNLVVLYDHAISQGHKTLVVGDGKQAIYRFRNGDYKQLMDLPKLQPGKLGLAVKDAERTFDREKFEDSLDNNYRTGREIVEWNNNLFEQMAKFISPDLQKVYEGLRQTPKKKFNGGGYLDFAIEKNKKDRRGVYTEKIVRRIQHHLSEGYSPGEITILVRDNETGSNLAQDLLSNGIKPQTEESLQLGRHPGPIAIVALMRWLLRPMDYRQSAIMLQCACAMQGLDEAKLLEDFVELIEYEKTDGSKGEYGRFNTYEMLEEVFPDLKIQNRTTGPLASFVGHACEAMGLTRNYPAYAEGMMELARSVSSVDESGIHGFLKVWDLKGKDTSIVTGKSDDAVQIMTVHKAKGLAFKIVISLVSARNFTGFSGVVPVDLSMGMDMPIEAAMMEDGDMKDTILEPQRQDELNRVLLDDINVTYVAFTRPVERLDIILELEKREFDEPKNMSQLVVWSLEKVYNSEVVPGNQTKAFSPKQPVEQAIALSTQNPNELKTGESINQLVVVSESEEGQTQPEDLSPMQIGTEVHRLLESIQTIEDWGQQKKSFESGMTISSSDKIKIIERVEAVLQSEDCNKYFSKNLHVETEQSFITSDGKIVRPDRIVKSDEKWTVIDYKSSVKGVEKHKKQVASYCEILSEIEGAKVDGIIIYTDPLKVLKVV